MLFKVEKGIRGALCHAIHQYEKASNKCMKDYHKNKESSYLKYWNVNNFQSWAMSQNFPVNDLKWVDDISEFNEDFIKSYDDESNEECFIEVDVQYPENLHYLHSDLPFFPERMKIEQVVKFVPNLHGKTEYGILIRNLKHA